MSKKLEALKVATEALKGDVYDRLQAVVKIREIVITDETLNGSDAKNTHPAFQAIAEALHEIKEPDIDEGNNPECDFILRASNLTGVIAGLGRHLSELEKNGVSRQEVSNDILVRCYVSKLRHLARI